MWHQFSLLILCCAVSGLDALQAHRSADPSQEKMLLSEAADPGKPDKDAASADKVEDSVQRGAQQPTAEPLEDEMDNQENIISQLLGDYDKVKTVSSGSDCLCRCIVRPIKRSDCSHIQNNHPATSPQDFYTVETITKGTDCKKCVCMAPPSAVNPCEGEYRFKKLQEASKDDIKAFTRNLTERAREKERSKEKEREKKVQQKKKKVNDSERAGQKSGAPALANKQKNDDSQMKNQQQDASLKADTSLDLVISDEFSPTPTFPTQNLTPSATRSDNSVSRRLSRPATTKRPTAPPTTTQHIITTTKSAPTTMIPTAESTTATTPKPTTTSQQTMTAKTNAQPTTPVAQHTTKASVVQASPVDASPIPASQPKPRSRLSWTESPADQPKTTKKPAVCKDTVASISEPVQHNSYGLSDGAWMRDARGHGNVIYLTNGHYGNNLLEFRDMDTFKSGQASNSYKLPYSFTGTGHVVFNGAFYYNRAFSRDVIRYDLRHRYVAAWTTLHDALLEEQAQRTQTEVEIAVDESGLWLLYPALDTEGFHQEVILLTHLRARDLQPVRSFRTGLRRGHYGNTFLVCGVLYAVNSMEHRYANVTYAFDTHTFTHTVPSLAFTNMHAHTSQLAYCPLDKKLYAWDNGHQMMYDVIFAY
ncbi:Olfactomedin-like protein 2B Photomedin-2 Precursor [Channa argus]|uniref:Olfactomedin-like protein 2B Photomedin-2 n=1 Tax=Channa argus TaxID=215402 RepID=A0A6G1Q8B3_CHAAH|nr:Olfactomedin-like protein 2B Photomedin-2 Precursor [Channa argus]